jgi:hypothetical protein
MPLISGYCAKAIFLVKGCSPEKIKKLNKKPTSVE